jgi:hypothetical protein
MSFDLIVYFTPRAGFEKRWERALAEEGVPLRVPEGVEALAPGPELDDAGFPYFEIGERRRGSEGDEDDSAHIPAGLRDVEGATTHEAFFTTSAGRSSAGLELQMIAAATLAKAGDGVVLDPQERGYMSPDEALTYARETAAQYRKGEEAQAARHDAAMRELDLRWLWLRRSFVASCAIWILLVLFVALMSPLGISASASWVPVVTLIPLISAIVIATRSTKNYLEVIGLSWPLPGLLGVASAFPPIQAIVYAWARARYRRIRDALG